MSQRMIALASLVFTLAAFGEPLLFQVATNGNDAWSGRLAAPNATRTDGPFASLERARDEIRKLKTTNTVPEGGVVVEIAGGIYEPDRPLALTAADGGTPSAPVVYRARPGETVRLVGGKVLRGWQPVTDPVIRKRLAPTAREHIVQTDLGTHGIKDFGAMVSGTRWGQSSPGLEVFFKDQPMTLARWPNEGFVKIVGVHGPTEKNIRGTKGTVEGIFEYEGDRPRRWLGESELMVHGYWFWDWADQRMRVAAIDPEKRLITLPEPHHTFGYRKGMHWYAYNILAELDEPGEWYLDRVAGILYFWPPEAITDGAAMVSVLPTLVDANSVAHLTIRGLTFEATRGTALRFRRADHVRLVACTIRNVGSYAVSLNGKESAVVGCDLFNMGDGGITLTGGDRKALTPGNLLAENNHLHHYGRWNPILKYGIHLNGVGNRMAHNLIHDAPHMAVGFGGNDHIIELNEMHSVVQRANDAGIIYAGYNPAMRGHVIRHNYFHHIYGYLARGANGVYLDDMFCSAHIYGNIFQEVHRAILLGGGRDNLVENNLFVDCPTSVHVDARMLNWAARSVDTMKKRLEAMPYRKEPWRSRYPELLTYLDGNYAEPRGNVIVRNVSVGGRFDGIRAAARPFVEVGTNLVDKDPRFVDAAKGDFRLRKDSPAWAMGFKPIPVAKIGLYKSPDRASWPVVHPVRPKKSYRPPEPPPPTAQVRRNAARVTIDGALAPKEWAGLNPKHALLLTQTENGNKVRYPSRAWLSHDGKALLVAVDSATSPDAPVRMGNQWGANDAVELAFRNVAAGPAAPILILRGYPSGHFASSNEGRAPAAAVQRAAAGVTYAAKVVDKTRWTAEWRVPLASLGLDPQKALRVAFNLTVRKTSPAEWVMWRGGRVATWHVERAGGWLEFVP
jgi:hypothetical protein